jgi:hypothetical protein
MWNDVASGIIPGGGITLMLILCCRPTVVHYWDIACLIGAAMSALRGIRAEDRPRWRIISALLHAGCGSEAAG